MPITPLCQLGEYTTLVDLFSGMLESWNKASLVASSSKDFRLLFKDSISLKTDSLSPFSESKNSTAILACAKRPAAFILGAILKTKSDEFNEIKLGYVFQIFLTEGMRLLFIEKSPRWTISLFSPIKGTTSAVVAIADNW